MDEIDTRAYRSKIGRLPWALRTELCERMREGHDTGAALCRWLNAQRAAKAARVKVSEQNLSAWRTTGYAAWLRGNERARHLRELAEAAQHVAEATGGDPAAVGSRILAGRMLDMLESADEEKAGEFARAVAALRKGENDAGRLDLERRKADLAREALDLERAKFRRLTCEMFLKWHADRVAVDIAAGPGTNDDKIKALLAYMDKAEQA